MNTLPPPEKSVSEIVDLASAFYGSAVLFAALDVGVFKALAALGGSADLTALAAETEAALLTLIDNTAAAFWYLGELEEGEE